MSGRSDEMSMVKGMACSGRACFRAGSLKLIGNDGRPLAPRAQRCGRLRGRLDADGRFPAGSAGPGLGSADRAPENQGHIGCVHGHLCLLARVAGSELIDERACVAKRECGRLTQLRPDVAYPQQPLLPCFTKVFPLGTAQFPKCLQIRGE